MGYRRFTFQVGVLLSMCLCSAAVYSAQKDVKGAKDHPVVTRYQGSFIKQYNVSDFTEFRTAKGPVKDGKPQMDVVEGKVTTLIYDAPGSATTLQVMRNYQEALKKAGFAEIFSCTGSTCGAGFPKGLVVGTGRESHYSTLDVYNMRPTSDYRFLSSALKKGGQDIYVSLFVYKPAPKYTRIGLDVVEVKGMATGLVTVDLKTLENSLETHGKAALYGIQFDHNEAVIKPESEKTLEVIAEFLKKQSGAKVFVVGHTDNTGAYKHNLDLSSARAQAVVATLAKVHGIKSARLEPVGVGPVSPVTTNSTENGRAKNRRVELVLKASK